ncbi:MAG: SCO family protein [Alphaproteobacteria bacterium]|nr:SCO family protein [Alphaproteobacteria bacterium]
MSQFMPTNMTSCLAVQLLNVVLMTIALGGTALAAGTPSVATDARVYAKPKALPEFALQDADGRPFTNEQLAGKWSLILLGFTHCPDICPFTLQNLAHVRQEMSTRVSPSRLPQIVFLAVDPERDRPVLAEYVRYFDEAIVGVSGEWSEIKQMVESLDGFVRITGKRPGADDYTVHHSAVVSLVSPEGKLVAGINPPLRAGEASIFIAETMLQYSRKNAKTE